MQKPTLYIVLCFQRMEIVVNEASELEQGCLVFFSNPELLFKHSKILNNTYSLIEDDVS